MAAYESRHPIVLRRLLLLLMLVLVGTLSVTMLRLIDENRRLKRMAAESFQPPISVVQPGETFPEVVVRTLEDTGEMVTIGGGSEGRPGILVFLTPTCQGCEDSLEAWSDLAFRAEKAQLEFRAIAFGRPDAVTLYQDAHKIGFPVLWAGEGNIARFRIESVPTTVLYDAGGAVTEVWRGTFRGEDGQALLQRAQAVRGDG